MIKRFLAILSIVASLTANSQTSVPSGNVFGNWTLAGSPYNVSGNITVPADSTLTIDPGVSVIFSGQFRFEVLGRIVAIGTPSDTIIFTASTPTPGWRGIRYNGITAAQDSSLFQYCKFQYAKYSYCSSCPSDYINGGAFRIYSFSKIRIENSAIIQCRAYAAGGGIYCKGSSPIITDCEIRNNVVVDGDGGGIYWSGTSLTIANNIITGNLAGGGGHYGGGVYCDTSSSVITGNVISGNTAYYGGGVCCFYGNPVITYNTISNNTSTNGQGGGIYCEANANITFNDITDNLITFTSCNYCGQGGGIYCFGDTSVISDNNIIGNTIASGSGGGIYIDYSASVISNNLIDSNTVTEGNGAGVYVMAGTPNLSGNSISFNKSVTNGDGGGIYCYSGNKAITGNIINHNHARDGGGGLYLMVFDTSFISGNDISYNSADIGGGIYAEGRSIHIDSNVISHDSALVSGGGGIFVGFYSAPLIENNTISENYSNSGGGGINCDGGTHSRIINNFITNNSALNGGGMYLYSDSTTIVGNVIVNNSAIYGGGGLLCSYSLAKIYNCTVANNGTGVYGGGFYTSYNSVMPTIRNTIVWGNLANNLSNSFYNSNVFHFDDCDVEGGASGNNINLTPQFTSPSLGAGTAFNGLLSNWSLQTGSPCIDTGDTTSLNLPASDIASNTRVVNQVDMGAYEAAWGPLSIENEHIATTSVHPNPFREQTTLQVDHALDNATLTIFNCFGQPVQTVPNINGNYVTISRQSLASGLYTAYISDADTNLIVQLVITDQ